MKGPKFVLHKRRGVYDFEVVGESFYQDIFIELCGPKTENSAEIECFAVLRPEYDNPHDENAVAVAVMGKKVAHLSRDDAALYRLLMDLSHEDCLGVCHGLIVGGWSRKNSEGDFGIKLDFCFNLIDEAEPVEQ